MKRFESYANRLTWSAAFVLTAFLAGCGGGDDGGGGILGGGGNAAPTVLSTAPADAATNVCTNQAPNASFSQAMNATTINATNFTVADATGVAVPGTVALDSSGKVATFTPTITAPATTGLAAGTTYTATIVGGANGAASSGGKQLAANKTWTFTTDDGTCRVQAPVALGTASTFAAAAFSGINNTGTLTKITGDAGVVDLSSTITGLHDSTGVSYTETATDTGAVSGTIFATDSVSNSSKQTETMGDDVGVAFNDLVSRGPVSTDPTGGTGEFGGLTVAPGVYQVDNCQVTTGDLTLDAQNDPNAIWVFQCVISGPVVGDTTAPRNVTLVNGAQAKNVYWASNGSATINAVGGGTMVGTIISTNGFSIGSATSTAATNLNGSAIVMNSQLIMHNAVIAVPAQ
jgi:hypothetical protein